MKVYIADKDQKGILIADKNVAHAIRHFNREDETITVLLDKVVIEINIKEIYKLSMCGVKAKV